MSGRPRALVFGDRVTPWRTHLPSTWRVEPLKYHVAINSRTLGESTAADFEFDYIDIGAVDGLGRIGEVTRHRFETAPSRARRIVRSGDTLISTVRTYLRAITYVGFAEGDLVCSTGFAVLSPGNKLDPRFLGYWMRSDPVVDEIVARSTGVSYPAVAPSEIGSLPIPVLHLVDQRAIADFLDEKTAAIDALIAKKERLIDLIEEKRQAAITRAVTKGLNPDVPMKDSGVGWIGEVPAHWKVWKAAHAFEQIGSGTTPRSDDISYYGGGVPWVTTSELRERLIHKTASTLTEKALKHHSALRVYPVGTLLVAMYGATIGRLGILGIPATVNQACCALSHSHVLLTLFAFYWLQAAREHLILLGSGGGQPNISQDKIRSLRIPTPPLTEQEEIVDYIGRTSETANAFTRLLTRQIDLLREYRQTLTSAAVTGQIDIRSRSTHTDDALEEALA